MITVLEDGASVTNTDIPTRVNNPCDGVETVDMVTASSEPLVSVEAVSIPIYSPLTSNTIQNQNLMQHNGATKHWQKRASSPSTYYKSQGGPPPPLPPKSVPNTERPNFALSPRNIKRNVHSVDGSSPKLKVMWTE